MQKILYTEQEQYLPDDPMESAIVNYIEDKWPEYICAEMLFVEALGYRIEDYKKWNGTVIGEIITNSFKDEYRRIGSHRFKGYGKQRAWVRIKEPEFTPINDADDLPFV